MGTLITCAYGPCSAITERLTGEVNRARKIGAPLYCDRVCGALGRRQNKPKDQKVAEKSAYDAAYREKNRAVLKAKKRAYFERTYDPAAAAVVRKARAPIHAEYCRRPEYREWKRDYDQRYRANKEFGPFAEAFLALRELEDEVLSRASRYEIDLAQGVINKAQQRRRQDGTAHRR